MTRVFCISVLIVLPLWGAETVIHRGRNEGTVSLDAANVTGNGNIGAFIAFDGRLLANGPEAYPTVGAQIGIAGLLQFTGQSAFRNFREIGPLEAHLQATLPGNDRLRPFNAAVRGDLYLSTSKDTVSYATDANKPEFNPFFGVTLIGDIDWLALFKTVPLKTYGQISLVDDPQLLYRYNQLALSAGAEWKMMEHGFSVDGGVALYKEKRNPTRPGDNRYEQYYCWLEPGGRYRLFHRFSIIGGIRLAVLQKVKSDKNLRLYPMLAGLTVRLEAPLYFRETNTEAIRTLVFSEQQRESQKGLVSESQNRKRTVDMGLKMGLDSSETIPDAFENKQQEMIEQRRTIQEKMDEIEKLLEETD